MLSNSRSIYSRVALLAYVQAGVKTYCIMVLDGSRHQGKTHLCSGYGVYEAREPSWMRVYVRVDARMRARAHTF